MKVLIDFESRSEAPLTGPKSVGAAKYAEHPSTEILCMGYKVSGGEPEMWFPDTPFPIVLTEAVRAGATFEGHGAGFEKAIWWNLLALTGIAPYPLNWSDTMAVCAYRSLPQGLDDVGDAIDLPIRKDKRGKYLIQRLCKRHKPSKKWPTGWVEVSPSWANAKTDDEAAALYQELYDYCRTDICSEDVLGDVLGELPEPEAFLWGLDQKINERGIRVDTELVNAAIYLAGEIKAKLTKELAAVTAGAVTSHNQTAKMLAWCNRLGAMIPNLQADTVAEWIIKETPHKTYSSISRVLEIRQTLAKSSVAKYQKIKDTTCADGRVHGTLNYHGAGRTGRWAGRGPQPQNLKRPTIPITDDVIAAIKARDLSKLASYGPPMEVLASAVRGAFIAKPGHDLIASDFTSIEARVTAWLAGEAWKLDMFRAGKDVYCEAAATIFGRPITKADDPAERQVGKICELAFGYGGGLGAWRNFDDSDKHSDEEVEGYKRAWRKKHPGVVRLWHGLNDAAAKTVLTGKPHECRGIRYEAVIDRAGRWLACVLPTGRRSWYYDPRVKVEDSPYGLKYELSYMGKNNKGAGKWDTVRTWGGMLTENVVQAISRDLLAEAIIRVECVGYKIVLHAHDEIVAEVLKRFGSQEELDALMSIVPAWTPGLPIDAEGWRGPRYRK